MFHGASYTNIVLLQVDLTAGQGKGKLVLILGNKLLHGISSIDGELLWTVESSELRYIH